MHLVGPSCRAHLAGAKTLTAGADTKIPIDTVDFDPAGAADTAHYFGGTSAQLVTNVNKFIVAVAGYYKVDFQVYATATATGQILRALLYQNGAAISRGDQPNSSAALDLGSHGGDTLECLVGDTVELYARSAQALVVVAGAAITFLTIQQVG